MSGSTFLVALSYPGEKRERVAPVAGLLARALGEDQVFYDGFHKEEIAQMDADLLLGNIYGKRSRLVVVFVGADYERKPWCAGVEWRSIRPIIIARERARVMLVRFDDGDIEGLQ